MSGSIEIVEAGVASTIQDRGRPGLADIGVPESGAVDPELAAVLNRLVGNDPAAALIETCGNLVLRSLSPNVVASSAAPVPASVRAGDVYTVPPDARRLWQYVAIRGGIAVDPVLGSRSTDTLSGLGPDPVEVGTRLAVGEHPSEPLIADVAPLAFPADIVRISPGPRSDWFETAWPGRVTAAVWTVTASSRVGVRLTGYRVGQIRATELPSEGLVRGAIQVPPDGDPVMMLADHPTTGGYPVVAVVDPDDVALLAQHAPGTSIRFRMSE